MLLNEVKHIDFLLVFLMFLLYIFAADVFAELMTIFWVYMGCLYGLSK